MRARNILRMAAIKPIRLTLGSFLLLAGLASYGKAQQRTFVSGVGSDSNTCSRTAPCRTFTQAISQTNAGGEIYVLDSAGYGPFTINKSVSIVVPVGVAAGISAFSGDGIDINAGSSDTVILRGLNINNQGSSGNGVVFNTGGTLHIESCVVNGFSSGSGVQFQGAGQLELKDSILRGNHTAIIVAPPSGAAFAAIDQVRLEGNGIGLSVRDGSKAVVRNSVVSGSPNEGLIAEGIAGAAELNVENCLVFNNTIGIFSELNATVRVSNSTVTDNTFGLSNAGSPALLLSRGNNTVEGNTTNTSGTIGPYTGK